MPPPPDMDPILTFVNLGTELCLNTAVSPIFHVQVTAGGSTQAKFFMTHAGPSHTLHDVLVSKSNYWNINIVLIILSGFLWQ
jgi:hypothetical protein